MEPKKLLSVKDSRGALCAVEALKDVPFQIRRIFYIYDNLNCLTAIPCSLRNEAISNCLKDPIPSVTRLTR